jgi:hypothetical protein
MSKKNSAAPTTFDPISEPRGGGPATPEFIRLPKPGTLCKYTGLSRSYLNFLILPTKQNKFTPPVRSNVLRQKGARTGVRLIDYQSLVRFIRANPEKTGRSAESLAA